MKRLVRDEVLLQVLLIGIGLLVALPIIIGFLTSFKTPSDVFHMPPRFLPSEWVLDNYKTAFRATPFGRYLINSFIQSSSIVVAQVTFSILAAYAFAVLEFPGRKLLFFVVLGSLMIPFELVFIPNFIFVTKLGLANTYPGLIVPFLGSAFGVFMLRQFFLTVPKELHDAAKIDGASNWRYLWQILVPLSRGAIGALSIFAFLGAWNQYLWPLIITDQTEMRTIQIGIRFFMENQESGADWGAIMAGSIIAMAPTMVAFLIAQKQLVKGIAMTGLKG
ncbi:MAG: carbohydrate ABC transporter permease [Chloroflexi bacterium]|nr:carbohydrate ABC transporter permease [Chloroflexota bacterium]